MDLELTKFITDGTNSTYKTTFKFYTKLKNAIQNQENIQVTRLVEL